MVGSLIGKAGKADYVIIDTYSTTAFYFALIVGNLARLFRIKYIPFLHGGALPDRLNRSPKLCKSLFGPAYVNVSPSLFLLDVFKKNGFEVTYIPNFIEINLYPYLHRDFACPNLLWVRSFHEQYNPQLAITVLHLLSKEYEGAKLCMIGPDKDGSLQKCKSLAKELAIDDRIEFMGKLPKPEWIEKSKGFDIFINTTRFDNMPVSIIEAMALGLPIVSTNVGGLPYLIENEKNGLLVPTDNAEAMTQAIKSLIQSPAKVSELSTLCRKAAEQFDIGLIIKKWRQILR